jgi:hypothetical protein
MEAGGGSWTAYRVTRSQVYHRMAPVEVAMPEVWPFVERVIERFCDAGAITRD